MPLTNDQREEIRRLAAAGKSGRLNDLAEKWGVPFKEVARAYADAQRELNPQPAAPPAPAQSLTDDQKQTIRRIAGTGETAKLLTLASDWNVNSKVVNRFYGDCRDELRRQKPSAQAGTVQASSHILPPAAPISPVVDVKARPGEVAILPRNWPLIQARLASGLAPKEIALAVGLRQTDYQRIEEGLQLPTADQAAKICALLKVDIDKTFVVAAQDPLYTKGPVKGLSLLGIMRARARLSMKDLAAVVTETTGVRISTTLVSAIERGQLRQPLAVDYPKQIDALAQYFGVTSEMVMAQVPPAWIQTVAANTAALHAAIKTSYAALPTTPTDPLLLAAPTGGDNA